MIESGNTGVPRIRLSACSLRVPRRWILAFAAAPYPPRRRLRGRPAGAAAAGGPGRIRVRHGRSSPTAQLDTLRVAKAGSMTGYTPRQVPALAQHRRQLRRPRRRCSSATAPRSRRPAATSSPAPGPASTTARRSPTRQDRHRPHGAAGQRLALRRRRLDRREARRLRQRPGPPAAARGLGDVEPVQGRPGSGHLEAAVRPATGASTREDWIAVKTYWKLTVTAAEKAALEDMLGTC